MSSTPVCEPAALTPGQALDRLHANSVILSRASARLPTRHAGAVDASLRTMKAVLKDVGALAHPAAGKLRAEMVCRLKALEALAEAAEVSRKQLEALASMCEAAASSGDPWVMRAALDTISVVRPLLCAGVDPLSDGTAYCCILDLKYGAALRIAGKWCGVVSGLRGVCKGVGLREFHPGEASTFRVVCTDDAGSPLKSLCSDDVDVRMTGGRMSSCEVVARGIVEVCYVCDAGVNAAVLDVAVFGFPGSPLTVQASFVSERVCSLGLRHIQRPDSSIGKDRLSLRAIAVSDDLSCIAVCDHFNSTVSIFSLPTGKCLHIWSIADPDAQWRVLHPYALCYPGASKANLLIAGAYTRASKNRVLEVSVDGTVIREFRLPPQHDFVSAVATHGGVVVVLACYITKTRRELRRYGESFSSLFVFDYATAALLSTVDGTTLPREYHLAWSCQCGLHISASGVIAIAESDEDPDSQRRWVLQFQLTASHNVIPAAGTSPLQLPHLPISVAVTEDGALLAVVQCPKGSKTPTRVEYRASLSVDAVPIMLQLGEDCVPRAVMYNHGYLFVLSDSSKREGELAMYSLATPG